MGLMGQQVPHLVHKTDKVDLILGLQEVEVVCGMPFPLPTHIILPHSQHT